MIQDIVDAATHDGLDRDHHRPHQRRARGARSTIEPRDRVRPMTAAQPQANPRWFTTAARLEHDEDREQPEVVCHVRPDLDGLPHRRGLGNLGRPLEGRLFSGPTPTPRSPAPTGSSPNASPPNTPTG